MLIFFFQERISIGNQLVDVSIREESKVNFAWLKRISRSRCARIPIAEFNKFNRRLLKQCAILSKIVLSPDYMCDSKVLSGPIGRQPMSSLTRLDSGHWPQTISQLESQITSCVSTLISARLTRSHHFFLLFSFQSSISNWCDQVKSSRNKKSFQPFFFFFFFFWISKHLNIETRFVTSKTVSEVQISHKKTPMKKVVFKFEPVKKRLKNRRKLT